MRDFLKIARGILIFGAVVLGFIGAFGGPQDEYTGEGAGWITDEQSFNFVIGFLICVGGALGTSKLIWRGEHRKTCLRCKHRLPCNG